MIMNCPICSTKFSAKPMTLKDGFFDCGCGYSIKKDSATPKTESNSFKSGIVKPI